MGLKTRIGRLSDLVTAKHRADWSSLNEKIKKLEPGEVLIVDCPADSEIPSFRSTILTTGRRIHKAEWRLRTRTQGRKIHCFLSPMA